MGNAASDPTRITQSFPQLYADGRGQPDLLIENLCLIVEKQINWNINHKQNDKKKDFEPCSQEDIGFMTDKFFTVHPYRPIESQFVRGIHCKNWIYVTYYLYDIFEEYSPFKVNNLIQNEWINEVFICSSYLSHDMDLYCCQLIDIMMKCWGIKQLTKYKFTDTSSQNKIHQLIEFKSFFVLNHCLNTKQYLKSFKTTAKNNKIYIYKIIENIQSKPTKNRGNIGIKLIEWFMNKKRYITSNEYNHSKYRLTYFDLIRIVILRIVKLKRKHNDLNKYHYNDYNESNDTEQDIEDIKKKNNKIEIGIFELNVLLSEIKRVIFENKYLEKKEYDEILHNEIILLSSKNTTNGSKQNRKLLSESEVLEFMKIIIDIRPSCLFCFSSFQNGCQTPLDLAKKNNLRKLTHFLEIKMNENKHILKDNKLRDKVFNLLSDSTSDEETENNLSPNNITTDDSEYDDEVYINNTNTTNTNSSSYDIQQQQQQHKQYKNGKAKSYKNNKKKYKNDNHRRIKSKSKSTKIMVVNNVNNGNNKINDKKRRNGEHTDTDYSDNSYDHTIKLKRESSTPQKRKKKNNKYKKYKKNKHDHSKSVALIDSEYNEYHNHRYRVNRDIKATKKKAKIYKKRQSEKYNKKRHHHHHHHHHHRHHKQTQSVYIDDRNHDLMAKRPTIYHSGIPPNVSPIIQHGNSADYIHSMHTEKERTTIKNPYYVVDENPSKASKASNDDNSEDIVIITKRNSVRHPKSPIFISDEPGNVILPHDGINNGDEFILNRLNGNTLCSAKQNEFESRIEILENENIVLKSDVRKLKKAVRELTNTVKQIMQTLQQQ